MVSELAPGSVVAGKFRLQKMLGRGGMGAVWVAQHLGLKTDVAVKFIDSELAAKSANALARFAQEAKAAAAIKSPHVVSVLDFGQDEHGNPYLAMELLHGEELEKRIEREKTISLDDTKRIVEQMCKALQKAHAAGFVHRDLKPENIFLCRPDEGEGEAFTVKILDFGLAKESGGLAMTGADEVLGTPHFMSPEQARGRKDIDFRTDLYSLGVVTFQCLTGRLPYDEVQTIPDLLISIVSREPVLASVLRPDLPATVVTWLSRAMQKDSSRRFDSAKEMSKTFVEACTAVPHTLVSVPRVSFTSDEEARGEDITIRAQHDDKTMPKSKPPAGEDITVRQQHDDKTMPKGEDATVRQQHDEKSLPKGKAVETSGTPPPADFRVDRTMPLGTDSSIFKAAQVGADTGSKRVIPDTSSKALPNPTSDPPPRLVVMTGIPPFWIAVIALAAITAGVYLLLQYASRR